MKPVIGIIGGAGPLAGALLVKNIVTCCQKSYNAVKDSDFPKIILVSYPFSQMLKPNTRYQKEDQVSRELEETLIFLEKSGASILAIACNTLHGFIPNTKKDWPLVNLIQETKQAVSKKGIQKTLVLCSKTSREKRVFEDKNFIFPKDSEQDFIDEIIECTLAGKATVKESNAILELVEKRNNTHISLLFGCTEFSVLFDMYPVKNKIIHTIDPLSIIAESICTQFYTQKLKQTSCSKNCFCV